MEQYRKGDNMPSNLLSYESMAKYLNDRVMTDYFTRLMLIARSVFEWCNLPKGLNEKWIERFLFSEGKCVFFKDERLGYMVASCTQDGRLNNYDEPSTVRPVAHDLPYKRLTNNVDCIVIQNNDECIPTTETIQLYAYRLTHIDRTIDVNIHGQKTPYVITCSERQRLSFKNAMKQRADNEPVIFADNNFDADAINSIPTVSPIVFDKLEIQKHNVWNECMTFLGLRNSNQDKKERLVTDEVDANNDQVEACFNAMLRAREDACKRINDIFGTNISVKKRIQPVPVLNDSEPVMIDSEGNEDDKS